jgi:hypothetical protein
LFVSFNNKSYRIFYEDIYKINTLAYLTNISDGKLTRKLYFTFMLDLIRDYLYYETSYNNNPNIASLRKLTAPILPAVTYEGINYPAVGTGNKTDLVKKAINKSKDYKLKDFEQIYSEKFVNNFNIDKNKTYTIFIPKHFYNLNIKEYFNKQNFNLIDLNRNELPQLIKSLIRSINIKTINNSQDLAKRIKIFNFNIVKNLEKLNKS